MTTKSKITKITATVALVISSFIAVPNTTSGLTPASLETEKTIKDYFKFPQIIVPVNVSQKVEVLFTTNINGQVDFVLAKTSDLNLKSEIEKQFLKLNLVKLKNDVVHSVTLNIKSM